MGNWVGKSCPLNQISIPTCVVGLVQPGLAQLRWIPFRTGEDKGMEMQQATPWASAAMCEMQPESASAH